MSTVLYIKANAKPKGSQGLFKFRMPLLRHIKKNTLRIILLLWIYTRRILVF